MSSLLRYRLSEEAIISESKYFGNGNDKLRNYVCPTCKESGGLFLGFFWIGCRKCNNLFITAEELEKSLS